MLCKVISTRTLGFDKETTLKLVMSNTETDHFIFRVFGIIQGHEIGKSHFKRVNKETGEAESQTWTKFFGEFFAVTKDGREFEAATCFLPNYVNGQFVTELVGGEEGAQVEFAYDIFAVYSKQSATSYEYVASPIKPAGVDSRMNSMKTALLATMPNVALSATAQLAAPASGAESVKGAKKGT